MFKSSENLRLAADMRALERVARPWREARRTWFDGTPESIEGRLAATERVLTHARAGVTAAHVALESEASTARAELRGAAHRLMVDFLDDGARAFKGSRRTANDDPYHGKVWPDDFPLPEGTPVKWNDDDTLTCPNCGYDEVELNRSSTCPECDHFDPDFFDDSDGDHNSFESQMERKYPILPEHGGPSSGLWGGKWAPRPFESARLAAGLPTDHRTAAQFGPGHVPSHGFPITEGDEVHYVGPGTKGHPDMEKGTVLEYPAMGPNPDDDDDEHDGEFPYHDLALVYWGTEEDGGLDLAEADEIVPRQHLDEYLHKFMQHGHPNFGKESSRRQSGGAGSVSGGSREEPSEYTFDWRDDSIKQDETDGVAHMTPEEFDAFTNHNWRADLENGHILYIQEDTPSRHDLDRREYFPSILHPGDPTGNVHHPDRPDEPSYETGVGKWFDTRAEAQAAIEKAYTEKYPIGSDAPRAPRDSGVDYDSLFKPDDLGDDYGDIFGKESRLFARLAADGMSHDDIIKHIDEVLSQGEGHAMHHQPGVDIPEPEHSGYYDHSDIFDHCRACGGDGREPGSFDACEGCDGTGENQGDPYGECEGCGGDFQIEDLTGEPDTGLYCQDCGQACDYCGVSGGAHRHGCPER